MEENARSVNNYSNETLHYYHVSMIPSDWYLWFDSSQLEKEAWMQVRMYVHTYIINNCYQI